jgi:hypothetical protein
MMKFVPVQTGARTMRQRSLALARRRGDIQPNAVLRAIGMITFLMLMWFGLVQI